MDPTIAEAEKNLALQALRQGDVAAASNHAERAVALDAAYPEGWAALGTVQVLRGLPDLACQSLRRAIALRPTFGAAWLNLCMALIVKGQWDDAQEALFRAAGDAALDVSGAASRLLAARREAFAHDPRPDCAIGLARLLIALGEIEEGLTLLRRSIAAAPDHAGLWGELAAALLSLGRDGEAEEPARQAARRAPDDPEHAVNLAGILRAAGNLLAAEQQALAAASAFPDHARAQFFCADVLVQLGRKRDAYPYFQAAAEAPNADAVALSRGCYEALLVSDWDRSERLLPRLRQRLADGEAANPFHLLLLPFANPELKRNAEAFCRAAWPRFGSPAVPAGSGPRIRLGYVSPDFKDHPVATSIVDLLAAHDRGRFEVRAYALGSPGPTDERNAIAAAVDGFVAVDAASDDEIARRLRDDGIDILIDLAGHTRDNRLGILSFRPAPLQIHFLGFPGTLGASFVDYLVGDPWITPRGREDEFSESILRLPLSYLVNSARPEISAVPTRRMFGFAEGDVIFASFNHSHKITRAMFSGWCDLLRAVPDAVLWLRADDSSSAEHLSAHARKAGLTPDRLRFAPRLPSRTDHLARYHVCDLLLDTSPYGGHSTAADALWMGCPVLTLAGDTFAARVCAGLLTACGLPEMIATDLGDYRERAMGFGRDRSLREALRRRAGAARQGPLFDRQAFAQALESGLQRIWERALRGLPPHTIDVA